MLPCEQARRVTTRSFAGKITLNIGNEVRDSTDLFAKMVRPSVQHQRPLSHFPLLTVVFEQNDAFSEASSFLGGTFKRMNRMADNHGGRWWYCELGARPYLRIRRTPLTRALCHFSRAPISDRDLLLLLLSLAVALGTTCIAIASSTALAVTLTCQSRISSGHGSRSQADTIKTHHRNTSTSPFSESTLCSPARNPTARHVDSGTLRIAR